MPRRTDPAGDFDYETHGDGYATRRQPDPRIEAQVHAALGDARTVLNVGAGAGSYEPSDRYVVAVEPSAAMRAQRPADRVPALDAVAEALPFDSNSFDAAMAMVTIHHWADWRRGLAEMRRIARGPVVLLTFDGHQLQRFWLEHYLPELFAVEARRFPPIDDLVSALGGGEVRVVSVPIDCVDGFGEAYYARPEEFLEADVRSTQSGFGFIDPGVVDHAMASLADDLASGRWDERYGDLRGELTYAGSLRLVIGT